MRRSARYQGAVLGALEDTEGALLSYGHAQTRREALQSRRRSER